MSNSAEECADGWASSVLELYSAYCGLGANAGEVPEDGHNYREGEEMSGCGYPDEEEIKELARGMALSVEVRAPWHSPGDPRGSRPTEYRILLAWGGPALRLVGNLNRWIEPTGKPRVEIQSWGTSWEKYRPCPKELENMEDPPSMDEVLIWFSRCFWFGK